MLAPLGLCFRFNFRLDSICTFGVIAVLRLWHFGWKTSVRAKKAQTINISPLRGDHAPEPIDMPFSILTPVTDVIIPAKFYVDPLKGF